jgi:glycosyltransferase involved in cell wall biosynthesis
MKKICILVDKMNWAWGFKAKNIKKWLSDEFDIVIYDPSKFNLVKENDCDCYLTFGFAHVPYLVHVPKHKRISGVTAHRRKDDIIRHLKNCQWLHANSVLLYKELLSWGLPEDRIFYVPNGVDEELFNEEVIPVTSGRVFFGYVGKPSRRKGQNFIRKAVQGFPFVEHLNNSSNPITQKDMVNVYNNFDVLIVASDEDGTPNPALEAAACCRTIISNPIGNMPEFIKHNKNGLLIPSKDLQLYKEAIKYLYDRPDTVRQMGYSARQTVEEGWTWKIMSENYRKMFNHILEAI